MGRARKVIAGFISELSDAGVGTLEELVATESA